MIPSREDAGVLPEDRPEDGGMKAISHDPTGVHMQTGPIFFPTGITNNSKILSPDFNWKIERLLVLPQREEIMHVARLGFSNYPP